MYPHSPDEAELADSKTTPGLETAFNTLRKKLLDISKRNNLTNAPVRKKRTNQLDIVDERSDEIFKILYLRGKKMTFEIFRNARHTVPGTGEADAIYVPLEQKSSNFGLAAHHVDTKLQTNLPAEKLQKKLLKLYRDAQTCEEEHGTSLLFLALGFLRWYESESSDIERFAPLILLPAQLQRDGVESRFKLVFRDQDLEPNLSLRAMLTADFGLKLPDFPEDNEWLPSEYFQNVKAAISSQPRWSIEANTIKLSFYSFSKFLMWKDLSLDNEWADGAGPADLNLIERLLVSGFGAGSKIVDPSENLDRRFPDPQELSHILDADASQTQVIAAVQAGRNLVVQGPPGTGKSQTIANIIAGAVKDGKRVLFVAEKRAALDVVHDRMKKCGLGPLCLELHSNKANRKHVYGDLKRTLELGEPRSVNDDLYKCVREVRDELNSISSLLHKLDDTTGMTPYGVIGRLAKLDEDGNTRPKFQIPGANTWSKEQFEERLRATNNLAERTAQYGCEGSHIWRGARKRLNRIDRKTLSEVLEIGIRNLDSVRSAFRIAAMAIPATDHDAASVSVCKQLVRRLEVLIAAPKLVPGLLESSPLIEQPQVVLENIEKLHKLRSNLLSEMVEHALELEWNQVRLEIAARGRSMIPWLSGTYRRAIRQLRSVQRSNLPKSVDARLAILDRLIKYQKLKQAIVKDTFLGRDTRYKVTDFMRVGKAIAKDTSLRRDTFDSLWLNSETDLQELLLAVRWIASQTRCLGSGNAVKQFVESVPPYFDLHKAADDLSGACAAWMDSWQQIETATDMDVRTAFNTGSIEGVGIKHLWSRLRTWFSDKNSMEGWHRLEAAGRHATELGLGPIRNRLRDGRMSAEKARERLEFIRADAVWKRMCREEPRLEQIDGEDRSAKIETFKNLDRQLQKMASYEIVLQHSDTLRDLGSSGQMGIVRGEMNKKTRHLRLRKLLEKAGEAVSTIKPVFLMSPISVAQYLKLGRLTFDILLIDEASQVRPEDAMGAILRSRQIVVVGDQKQLPPTSFFKRLVSDESEVDFDDTADIQASQAGDMESILALCEAKAMAGGMLQWHYRSRHPSLIQVSNYEFYNNRLICPPNPELAGTTSGLTFEHVDGVYDRGKKRNNPKEAEAIVEAILVHARKHPDETLGVVAFSRAQRDTIRNQLELKRSEFPDLDAFCKEDKNDAFFVKNIENVQGDERDVIFISIGYGRNKSGYMAQSFGPVSSEGGERRLNVLFTRAKIKCRVFSTIQHTDIRVDAAKHAGPKVLKKFLKFAETGNLDIPVLTGGEADSPFEEAVSAAIEKHGFRVAGQVGSAGFKIDLAIYDPDHDGRFLLAIECDGARYHSSSWARERDRLRQLVLEQKGWRFHRIWSTDWFYNPDAEMAKLLEAIKRARSNHNGDTVASLEPLVIERSEPAPKPKVKYMSMSLGALKKNHPRLYRTPPDQKIRPNKLARLVESVVNAEGPIHIQQVEQRLIRFLHYQRTNNFLRERIEKAVQWAVDENRIRFSHPPSNDFLDRYNRTEKPIVRDRGRASDSIRNSNMIPPSEIKAGIVQAVERNIGINPRDCAREVARMLGYKSTSRKMKERVAGHAKELVREGKLRNVGDELRLP